MKIEVTGWFNKAKFATLILIIPIFMFAATYTSSQDGAWSSAATWGGAGVPAAGDSAIIGNAVTLTADTSAQYVQINGGGSLAISTYTIAISDSIVGAGSVTISTGTLDVGGNISVGTITCSGAANINLEGGWNVSSFTASTSTITFDGSGAQSIESNNVFYDMTSDKSSGTLTINSNLDIDNALTLSSGTVDVASGNIISFYGTGTIVDVATGANFSTTSSGQLYFDDDATIQSTVASTNLPGLQFTRTASRTLTLAASGGAVTFTVRGEVERGGRANLSLTSSPAATLAYAPGITLKYSASNTAMTAGPEWPGTNGPDNVTNVSAVNVTLSEDRTIPSGGNLILNQTTTSSFIVDSGNTLIINGTLERRTTGTTGITVNGTLSYGSIGSVLTYNASNAVTIGAEWPTGTSGIPENVTITITTGELSGSNTYYIPKDLNFNVGSLNLSSDSLIVLGNVIGSDVAGSTTINDATTLVMGNSGIGTSYAQTIQGSLTLNKMVVNKTGGSSVDSNMVSLTGTGALSFTENSVLTITAGTLNFNGNTLSATGSNNTILINDSLRTGGTSLAAFETITATSGSILFNGDSQENIPVCIYLLITSELVVT